MLFIANPLKYIFNNFKCVCINLTCILRRKYFDKKLHIYLQREMQSNPSVFVEFFENTSIVYVCIWGPSDGVCYLLNRIPNWISVLGSAFEYTSLWAKTPKNRFKSIWTLGPFLKWSVQIAHYFGYSSDCAELCGRAISVKTLKICSNWLDYNFYQNAI